jgi:uncharacterized membrane protein
MRTQDFLNKLHHQKIVDAIAAAEKNTSGQIRVYIQRGLLSDDVVDVAQLQFRKLGMRETRERNGVLILVVPRSRKFAVVGDEGVHQKCGDIYWQRLVEAMREEFQREHFNEALLEAIAKAGTLLAEHFPKKEDSSNELPDEVIEG